MIIANNLNTVTDREWSEIRKKYINTGKIEIEDFERLDEFQLYFINQMKLYFRKQK